MRDLYISLPLCSGIYGRGLGILFPGTVCRAMSLHANPANAMMFFRFNVAAPPTSCHEIRPKDFRLFDVASWRCCCFRAPTVAAKPIQISPIFDG